MYLEDIYTVHANLTGLPSISLPLNKHTNGLPYGFQLTAKSFNETALLAFSHQLLQNKINFFVHYQHEFVLNKKHLYY